MRSRRRRREAIAAREPDTCTIAKAVLVRDQRRRWGSCSVDGTIRFNWRIAMVPPEFVDYIAVHELCHLRHPNHSPAFWAAVMSVLPTAKELRKRLSEIRLPL